MLRRAGVFMVAVILSNVAGATLPAAPASAGGWAVTVIDPAGVLRAGKAHRVSFWVLQHGTHPYSWAEPASIGTVGLTLTDNRGSKVTFNGEPLPEPAHYVTTVTVPSTGRWRVTAVQGVFAGFHVGSLSVPGGFEPLGVPAAPSTQDIQKFWPGAVRPPVLPIDRNREPFGEEHLDQAVVAEPAPAQLQGEVAAGRDQRMPIIAGGLALLLAVLALTAGRRWIRRGAASVSR